MSSLRPLARTLGSRAYATVSAGTPSPIHSAPEPIHIVTSELDTTLLNSISASQTGLRALIHEYTERSGRVLDSSLRYESRPADSRRITFDNGSSVAMIAHCVNDGMGRHKVTVSSGFALAIPGETDGSLVLTCAHTLEEIRRSPFLLDGDDAGRASGSFLVSGPAGSLSVNPISAVVSAIPRSDILLLKTAPASPLPTLPVSPYPVQRETAIRAHFVTHERPQEDGWTPWVGDTWSKWVRGTVLGYRDFAGRETQPGTYDSLSHMLFSPLPTPGSSGGPIVDEESGAVVGVMLGTRMDNRVEGVRGWGIPAETIFELFRLPGLWK